MLNKFIPSGAATLIPTRFLQVGQWVLNSQTGRCSRVVRGTPEGQKVQLHPGHGIGTVEQRCRRAWAGARQGMMSIDEPQATALAVSLSEDVRKLTANANIIIARIADIKRSEESPDVVMLQDEAA